MTLPSINLLHLTLSEIQLEQDFIGQGHYSKVKSQLKVTLRHIAHLRGDDPKLMSLPSINFLQLMVSEI